MKQFKVYDEVGCLLLNGIGVCKFCSRTLLKGKSCGSSFKNEDLFVARQQKLIDLINNKIKNQTNIVLNLKGVNNG